MLNEYTPQYFADISEVSRASAAAVAPLVMAMLRPQSVVDVGCGLGHWAAAFKQLGVKEVLGIDGPYVKRDNLVLCGDEFVTADLTKPLQLPCKFDLAISLEVAEHLPESAAEEFVAGLTHAAPAVLFSAAIPHQGGQNHVNEQWPAYWAQRFADHGYQAFDVLRPRIWSDLQVQWWYAQNMLLFAAGDPLHRLCEGGLSAIAPEELLPLIHPANYEQKVWQKRVLEAAVDLATVVPPGSTLVLADDGLFGVFHLPDRVIKRFTEENGSYAGPPADAAAAIAELKRQAAAGAQYMVFGWPSFWQMEHYGEFSKLLRTEATTLLENDRLIVFELNWQPSRPVVFHAEP